MTDRSKDKEENAGGFLKFLGLDDSDDDDEEEARRRWKLIKKNLALVVAYGVKTGQIQPKPRLTFRQQQRLQAALGLTIAQESPAQSKEEETKKDFELALPVHDTGLMHQGIPFLPLPVAILMLMLNIIGPGSGTILCGFFLPCMGSPRLQVKHARIPLTIVVNMFVGFCQLATVSFMLVGWGWSIAWGAIMVTHSLQYRKAMKDRRKAVVATAAIDALTKTNVFRRKRSFMKKQHKGKDGNGDDAPTSSRSKISKRENGIKTTDAEQTPTQNGVTNADEKDKKDKKSKKIMGKKAQSKLNIAKPQKKAKKRDTPKQEDHSNGEASGIIVDETMRPSSPPITIIAPKPSLAQRIREKMSNIKLPTLRLPKISAPWKRRANVQLPVEGDQVPNDLVNIV